VLLPTEVLLSLKMAMSLQVIPQESFAENSKLL
jgi:hypothetical protein